MSYSANTYKAWHTLLEQGPSRATYEEAMEDARDIMRASGGTWQSWARMSDEPHEFEQTLTQDGYRANKALCVRVEPSRREVENEQSERNAAYLRTLERAHEEEAGEEALMLASVRASRGS